MPPGFRRNRSKSRVALGQGPASGSRYLEPVSENNAEFVKLPMSTTAITIALLIEAPKGLVVVLSASLVPSNAIALSPLMLLVPVAG